jgi:two-component sensor histidine kinase
VVLDASALIERDLAGITATLQSLATSHALRAGDLRAFHEQAMQVRALTGLDPFLRDREGREVLDTWVPGGAPLPGRSALAAWEEEVLETSRPVVSGHFVGGSAGGHSFGVVVPVFRNGVIGHFLHATLPAARLRDLLARADLAEGWTLVVADRDGTVLARLPDHDTAAGTPVPVPDLLQTLRDGEAMEATGYAVDQDGRAVFVAMRRSQASGWALIGTASVERLLAPLRHTLRLAGIAGAALVALALVGAWLLGDRLARAIRALAALGAAVEAGVSVQPPRTGIREVNEVGEALANASARLAVRAAEREETAERQRLMLRELNHRVRNTLATVDSVTRLTARHASNVAEYEARLTDRIRSLAKTHELLTGADWTQAGLAELLRAEFAAYGQDGGQFRLDGPPVTLPARQAVAVGMLLHELATNAAKYGALSVPEGRVEVRWTLREDPGGARRLDLTWEETGGPPVRPPTRRGFGTQLIERAIARDLGAEVVADYDPRGLRFRLSMPLSEPSDPDDGPPGAEEASAAPAAG